MRVRALAWLALLAGGVGVGAGTGAAELALLAEHPIDGLVGGNLSGLAWCGAGLQAVSDRADDRLYRLDTRDAVWQAAPESFAPPAPPANGLPWGLRASGWLVGLVRGGRLDFEGLSCDAAGNRYLVSEAAAAVLKVTPDGTAAWLELPSGLLKQARARGLLLGFNALFEGIAIEPGGQRLWLAAERERRGLLGLVLASDRWQCQGSCVLLAEGGLLSAPGLPAEPPQPADFSGLAFFAGKLFTLQRQERLICRRDARSGQRERCWSYAATALAPPRRYAVEHGVAEALWLDADGAWVGVDNGNLARADGETRPIVWRFAAPPGGWSAVR